jgi:hypothetical protein
MPGQLTVPEIEIMQIQAKEDIIFGKGKLSLTFPKNYQPFILTRTH